MAALFQNERDEFVRRDEAGRVFFRAPDVEIDPHDPGWLDWLLEIVAENHEPDSPMGSLGMRYREEDGFWEVDVYPTPVELVGGAEDGAVVAPAFSLDLERLRAAFTQIEDFGWSALGWGDGSGPFIWLEGQCQGRGLFLRVLAQAPEGEEAETKLRMPE